MFTFSVQFVFMFKTHLHNQEANLFSTNCTKEYLRSLSGSWPKGGFQNMVPPPARSSESHVQMKIKFIANYVN